MSIWFKNYTLEEMISRQSLVSPNINDALGIQITEIGDDFLRGIMPVDERTFNMMGIMHGGAYCVLAESLGSLAANFCLDSIKYLAVGLDIHTTYIRSVSSGIVTGTAKPIHIGRSTQVWEINIVDDASRLLSVTRLTVFIKSMEEKTS